MRITKNNLEDVFKSPLCGVETMEVRGYELIEELFCDSSGFGQPDELSLTPDQLNTKLTEIVKKHGTVYTTITNQGQFQVYVGVFKHTGKKTSRKIANNTWELLDDNGRVKAIRLHDTNIIKYQGNKIIIDSGGWKTNTTKARLNQYLPLVYKISQKNFDWFLTNLITREIIPFYDGMELEVK